MRRAAALAGLLFAAPGCADVCARAEGLHAAHAEKLRGCSTARASGPFDEARCRASASGCSPAELEALHRYFDCLEALPPCTEATRAAFSEAAMACAAPLGEVTEGCVTW